MKRVRVRNVKEGDGHTPRSFLSDRDGGDFDDEFGKNSELLPGLPDQITISHIATKISWKDVYNLSSVSRRWEATIKSREILQARSLTQSTKTFFAFQGHSESQFLLYSLGENRCYRLPPIPDIDMETFDSRSECGCVVVEGKLYVFGGNRSSYADPTNVFVYDLVRPKKWKACAPMEPRMAHFQCAVIHGKIYVFNGAKVHLQETGTPYNPLQDLGYSVYDPKEDSWSPVTFKTSSPDTRKFYQRMVSVGEKLLVYQGPIGLDYWVDEGLYQTGETYLDADVCCLATGEWKRELKDISANMYSTTTGEWTTIHNVQPDESDLLIKIDDKIHRIYRPASNWYYEDMDEQFWHCTYFRDGAVVDDVLYLLVCREVHIEEQDDYFSMEAETALVAISEWKRHVTFDVDAREDIEVTGTTIGGNRDLGWYHLSELPSIREIDCCLPIADRVRGLFRCPVQL